MNYKAHFSYETWPVAADRDPALLFVAERCFRLFFQAAMISISQSIVESDLVRILLMTVFNLTKGLLRIEMIFCRKDFRTAQ